MSDSVVETNIPITRLPYAAGSVPPKVPYCDDESVGDTTHPVYVEDRKIKQTDVSLGGPKKPIFLEDGGFAEGDEITKTTVTPILTSGTVIASIDNGDGEPVALYSPSTTTVNDLVTLKLPVLTPLWFDHEPEDKAMWVPAMAYGFENRTEQGVTYQLLKEQSWPIYTANPSVTATYNKNYARIWEHLIADWREVQNNANALFTDAYTLSDNTVVKIAYRRASDGHKLINMEYNTESVLSDLNKIYNDDAIGASWYFLISANTPAEMRFRLPRTKYGFHGTRSLVKRPYQEECDNVNMRLYFCTGMTGEEESDTDILEKIYPVGSVYLTFNTSVPAEFPGGINGWKLVGQGKCLWGNNGSKLDESSPSHINAGLPMIPNHLHAIYGHVGNSNSASSDWKVDISTHSGSYCPAVTRSTDKYLYASESDVGQLNKRMTKSGVYGNSSTVQPPAMLVNIFVRVS